METSQTDLDWQNGQPYSTQFGDIYFSSESGMAESQYVFLQHNHLADRWPNMSSKHFCIAETGFGTGLNFLTAWDLWSKTAPSDARLHFISVEKYPLNPHDMKLAQLLWPSLGPLSQQLLDSYGHLSDGIHRWIFDHGRISLTLMVGDASNMLSQLHASVDAWFLDGFAPSKNPDMWQPALFEQMARLSHRQTTFSTFTSAGMVKRNLADAGFKVEKIKGYGQKREMLCGSFTSKDTPVKAPSNHAIVIGAGIAGCSSSHALAIRGWQVSLIERHTSIATEASGNPIAVLYPRIAMQETLMSQLSLSGFLYSHRLIHSLGLTPESFAHSGLLQLAFDAREMERCKAISNQGFPADIVHWVDSDEASRIAGTKISNDALHFPLGGWVKPKIFCEALVHHPNIQLKPATEAIRIENSNGMWQVWDEERLLDEAPVLIIATANESLKFDQTRHLHLQPVRGQVSMVPVSPASRQLQAVLCTDGYLSPAIDGYHCLGATFSPDDTSLELRDTDHQANMAMLEKMAPELYQGLLAHSMQGRAALRVATPDYLPLVGAIIEAETLSQNPPKHYAQAPDMPYLEGLYINTGHGSKGITQAPLCAELLASAICGEPLPMASKIVSALDPNRFLLRKLGLKNFVKGLTSPAMNQH